MKNVALVQDENLSFVVCHQLLPQEYLRLDLYLSLPEDMGINVSTLNEEDYFYSSIKSQSAYYCEDLHLPLVRSRFISQQKGESTQYRSNLNLFAYQLRAALDSECKEALKLQVATEFYDKAIELVEQTKLLLKKLRRYTPPDQKLSSYFENVDNYLSWYVEQSILRLLANGPKSSEQSDRRESLILLCQQESEYRDQNSYNSRVTIDDPNRITNKMRLLQRLSEYGVVFQKTTNNLNANLKRFVRGAITAVIMAFVMSIVLNARSAFTEVTLVLIAFLGLLYGVREIFKDDLIQYIWRRIQKGRPKWQLIFTNSLTTTKICNQLIWLEYIEQKDLPSQVDKLFQERRQQNKQPAKLLHFRCDSKVLTKKFMPGYKEIKNQVFFSLTPMIRYLQKGEGRLYALDGSKISHQGVERRYQINIVLVQQNRDGDENVQRFKVTINRSKIINIEPIKANQVGDESPIETPQENLAKDSGSQN